MKNIIVSFLLISSVAMATSTGTLRTPQPFKDKDVEVWNTTIAPKGVLESHRHDHRRIVVPLNDTKLKITDKKGVVNHVEWKKGTAYLLPADKVGIYHSETNESDLPAEIMVIQFKK